MMDYLYGSLVRQRLHLLLKCFNQTVSPVAPINSFWLPNPDQYSKSSSFTYKGVGLGTISAQSGDKIRIELGTSSKDDFGVTTYTTHSVNVISSGTNPSTRSKVGSYGVYTASLQDMYRFYNGFVSLIYR